MTYYESNLSSSIPTAGTASRPYGHEHEREKHHDHGPHTLAPPSTTTVSIALPPPPAVVLNIFNQSAGSETVITFTSTSRTPSVDTTQFHLSLNIPIFLVLTYKQRELAV
ncbi:hypothetical protein D9757_009271 [Collybiopsis confluens]|uniref:Uncharacterized protein n=1 Tax=Collybiopsis confluens TaxID=2823264 RepID=A0A8H5H9R1_9AGAR|nr:hypothetical protein D9757_009271 [Collybiopsis confluens]